MSFWQNVNSTLYVFIKLIMDCNINNIQTLKHRVKTKSVK